MHTLLQDLRYALRTLLKKPGFALIAIVTLALGIGANTAIFTVVNAVLLRPLPYPESERLMEVGLTFPGRDFPALSEPKFVFLRDNNQSFEAVTATQEMGSNTYLFDESQTEYIRGLIVSADFFRVLGVLPSRGRGFTKEEDSPAGERVVILSDGLWRRRFGSETGIVGNTITLNGNAYTVVGIMPLAFEYAHRNFAGGEPLGQQLCIGCERFGDPAMRRVVGVVNDTKQRSLDEASPATVFIPMTQAPEGTRGNLAQSSFVLRTTGDPLLLSAAVRSEMRQLVARTCGL